MINTYIHTYNERAVLQLHVETPVIIASCGQYGALPHPGFAGRVAHNDMVTKREIGQVRRLLVELLFYLCIEVLSLRRGVGRAGGSVYRLDEVYYAR